MLAYDWLSFLIDITENTEAQKSAFLLIDYPGYGKNLPTRQPASEAEVLQNSEAAILAALKEVPGIKWISLMGHSLGSAAALQVAAYEGKIVNITLKHLKNYKAIFSEHDFMSGFSPGISIPIRRIVLSAPFLSVAEAGRALILPGRSMTVL